MMYIYGLCDPRNGELRYVGVTDNPKERFRTHLQARQKCHRTSWIQSLRARGLRPEMFFIEEVRDENWIEAERFWIAYFKFIGANLTNSNDGGRGNRGYRPTEATRLKIKESCTGQHRSPEVRARIIASKLGSNNPMYGKSVSESTRAKLREANLGSNSPQYGTHPTAEVLEKLRTSHIGKPSAMKGKHHTDETKAKISARKQGGHASEETRQKISVANRGKSRSPETRANMSKAQMGNKHNLGHKLSPESRQKIREATKRQWDKVHALGGSSLSDGT